MMPNKLIIFLIFTSVSILMTSQGSSGACASCRYQRRRCTPDCIFRPYFPAERRQDFLDVHRLFGVSYVQKVIKDIKDTKPELQEDAMKSIIFQSNMRARFPVHGCYQYTCDLLNQIAVVDAELLRIHIQITAAAAARNPSAAFFNPAAGNFFNPTAAVESELINPSRNLTANNDDFARVPANDGTINFLTGGGYCGDFAYDESVTETRPLERANNNAQQFLPNSNNHGSIPGPANEFDFFDAIEVSEQCGGVPPRKTISGGSLMMPLMMRKDLS